MSNSLPQPAPGLVRLSFEIDLTVQPYSATGWPRPLTEDQPEDPSQAQAQTQEAALARPAKAQEPSSLKFWGATVRMLADGVEPLDSFAARPFDAVCVLLNGLKPGEFDFYTCSCGVAGCAGLHEGVTVLLCPQYARWEFPADTYNSRIAKHFNPVEGEPTVLIFDRKQYALALFALKARLMALAHEHSPLLPAPWGEVYGPGEAAGFETAWPALVARVRRMRLERSLPDCRDCPD